MSDNKHDKFSILTIEKLQFDETQNMFPSPLKIATKYATIPSKVLVESLSEFLNTLGKTTESLPKFCGDFEVSELIFSLNINSSGKISLIGELSTGNNSGISIKLTRK